MIKRPFFSIIVPVYNTSTYLYDCLQSIISQTFKDWETILIDDCSTDNSVTVIKDLIGSDSKFKLLTLSKNSGGAYIPRIRGANLARGKYIVIIDSDDMVATDFLELQYQGITSCNADLAITEMWKLKGAVSSKILPSQSIDISKVWVGKDLVKYTLCEWEISMNGLAVRRDIFLKADSQVLDKDKKSIFADEFQSRWILYLSQKVVLVKARYYYRFNESSVTHTNIPRFIESRLIICDSLVSMTAKTFGGESPTHLRALDNKFLSIVDLLRLINNSKLNSSQKNNCIKKISAAMKDFSLSKLKGRISPRYLAVMRLPIPAARIAFRILDPIMGIKKCDS